MSDPDRPRVCVSTCLLGERVRYDGDTKPHAWVRDELSRLVNLVPNCPETELGMGVPREPVDLHGSVDAPRMVGVTSGEDWTERMTAWCRRRVEALLAEGLDGAVLKSRSPSCGVGSTAVKPDRVGDGLFALALRTADPELPIVEDEDLDEASGREAFLVRVMDRMGDRQNSG